MDHKTSRPHWMPRHGAHPRWDRSFALGDAVFRWHSRLDGSALLYGPAGKLAVGDTVPMPVGHLHKPGVVAPVMYVVTQLHEDDDGHVWLEAVRRSQP